MSGLHIVALLYVEPYYRETVQSLDKCNYPVTFVERPGRGTGSLSYALNRGFEEVESKCEFVWFTTDITFTPEVPAKLMKALEVDSKLAAIHPAHFSDHPHHRPDGSGEVRIVPYVEFTGPMWRTSVFRECGMLDENHWYAYQDLLISREARLRGYKLAVHHGAEIGHTYRRTDKDLHPITRRRYGLRRYRDKVEARLLESRLGPNWRNDLWAK